MLLAQEGSVECRCRRPALVRLAKLEKKLIVQGDSSRTKSIIELNTKYTRKSEPYTQTRARAQIKQL